MARTRPLAEINTSDTLNSSISIETDPTEHWQESRNRYLGTPLRRMVGSLSLSLSLLGGISVTEALPAHASLEIQVQDTGSEGLWVHSGPGIGTDRLQTIADGTNVTAECYNTSDAVEGDPVWVHGVAHIDGSDIVGDMSDRYLSTSNWQTLEQYEEQTGLRKCADPTSTIATSETVPQLENPTFSRLSAAQWALDHAKDPQTNGSLCTWFVSRALWAGGIPQTPEWNANGGYWSRGTYLHGTVSANAVVELNSYLERHNLATIINLGHLTTDSNNLFVAEPGNLIEYDWEGDGRIDHASIVVGASSSNPNYALVSEMGQFDWEIPGSALSNPTSEYTSRGWTYSEKNHNWLTAAHPNVVAYLVQIHGGHKLANY